MREFDEKTMVGEFLYWTNIDKDSLEGTFVVRAFEECVVVLISGKIPDFNKGDVVKILYTNVEPSPEIYRKNPVVRCWGFSILESKNKDDIANTTN